MKIALFARELGPVGCLRLLDPLRALGHDVQYAFMDVGDGVVQIRPGIIEWADVLVVQRNFPGPDLEPVCAAILASKKPTVYEADDIVWAFESAEAKRARPYILKFVSAANLVTVSTQALADELLGYNRNVIVLPNYLNDRLWSPFFVNPLKRRSRRIRIGYVGASDHFHDINDLRPILLRIQEKHSNVDLCFMGCKPNAVDHLPHVSYAEENYDYALFPKNLANLKLDIGLLPLRNTPLNRCRTPVKFFDYSLVGAVSVASADSPYESVVRNGENGYLCSSPTEWFDALNKLVEDAPLRKKLAFCAQQEVLGNWMLSDHANLWETAYRRLLKK